MAFLCCCSSFTRSQMPDLSLSLVSSSNTFLIGLIVDKDSRKLVYSIDTVESLTSILRHTPPTTAHRGRARENRTRSHTASPPSQSLVASVQWPERSPHIVPLRPGAPQSSTVANPTRDEDGVRVHLDDGSVTPLPRFLKHRSQALAGTLHKFRIPGYPTTFKWKRNGRKYQLRATGIRSLLAELTSDTLTASLELNIYGAFIPSHHNQDQPGSVSSVLLDYTVLTALLLVTPLREWTRFSRQVRSIGGVSSAWGDGDGESDVELASDEWEEPSRFRWGRAGSHGHGHGLGLERQQQQRQDQRLRGGQCRDGDGGGVGSGEVEVDEWVATSDEMREVANAALFTASRFARRRSIASTDSNRTLVTPHPTIVVPTTTHTTGGSATHAQEVVRRALAMELERELGDYPCGLRGGF